jgi:hypothetical protein
MKNTKRNAPGQTHSKQTKPDTKGTNAKRPEIRDDMDSRSRKEVGYSEDDNNDKETNRTGAAKKTGRRDLDLDNEE